MLEMTHFLAMAEGEMPVEPAADYARRIRRMLGAFELARSTVAAASEPLFPRLVPHLRLIGRAKTAVVVQNDASDAPDDTTNKMFELCVAFPFLPFADDVELEHPLRSSGGANPDLLATIDGTKWGIACKTIYSADARKYVDNVAHAVRQLCNAECDQGLVFLNLRNLIRHDQILRQLDRSNFEVFEDESGVIERLDGEYRRIIAEVDTATSIEAWRAFDTPKVVPAIVQYGASAALVRREGKPRMRPVLKVWLRAPRTPKAAAADHLLRSFIQHTR
jgi:hypothetical protein